MCLGVPGLVLDLVVEGDAPIAEVDFAGEVRRVCSAYLPDLRVGEYVMAHLGFAVTRLDAETAADTLVVMREHGVLDDSDLRAAARVVARRVVDGGTCWFVAPDADDHARRLVERFGAVAPATGARLRAAALTGPDHVGRARDAVRAGDVLLLVTAAAHPTAVDLLRRAPAWGATTVWAGSGPRPAGGAADHVLWDDTTFRLLFRYTAELLARPEPVRLVVAECNDEVCVTCSDEGRLGEVTAVPAAGFEPAMVRTAQGVEPVDVTLLGGVSEGDLVLVHAGTALTRVTS